MKKTIRRILCVLSVMLLCVSIATVAFGAYYYKGSVRLSETESSDHTDGYVGHLGYGKLTNYSTSAGNVQLDLQFSTGSGWTTAATVITSPGNTVQTSVWGRTNVSYLIRVVVSSTSNPWFSDPGRIADGYVYTDIP